MNLIIISNLSYNEGLYFRYVTMMAKEELDYNILIEAEKNDIDYCFNLLKKHGWFDFVDDFILPEQREEGVRIDKNLNYPRTIQVDSIKCENALKILNNLKNFKQF